MPRFSSLNLNRENAVAGKLGIDIVPGLD